MDETKLENRLTRLESAMQDVGADIVEIKDTQKEIRNLALSVNALAQSVNTLCRDMTCVNDRLRNIELKPEKRLEMIIAAIIGLLASGFGGFIIGKILGG